MADQVPLKTLPDGKDREGHPSAGAREDGRHSGARVVQGGLQREFGIVACAFSWGASERRAGYVYNMSFFLFSRLAAVLALVLFSYCNYTRSLSMCWCKYAHGRVRIA